MKSIIKKILILLLCVAIIAGVFVKRSNYFYKLDVSKLDTEKVSKGSINKIVVASGIINPFNIVKVGAQITSIIQKLHVDYNDVIKKDQILAVLDKRAIEEQIKIAESHLKQNKVNLELAKLTYKRTLELFKNNYVSQAELDKNEADLKVADENYKSAQATYNKYKIELSYTVIRSPVSGVVIERKVSEGQTVASGFSAPELFYIAEDLTKMRIETSVSEADISLIQIGQEVMFVVDAFKQQQFKGTIKEIRLNPVTEQSVVIYTVIIDFENPDKLLLPGMTAYVSILIDSRYNVLRINNTALLFNPDEKIRKLLKIKHSDYEDLEKELKNNNNKIIIYLLRDKNVVEPILVEKGLSDITYTEVKGIMLHNGDEVISNYLIKTEKKKE